MKETLRPTTTLFLLMTVDGKISTGDTDEWDVDKDIPNISGNPANGLKQYYDEESKTDLWSLNSGRVMAKVGMNEKTEVKEKWPVSFVFIDNNHMKATAIRHFASKAKMVVVVTSNPNHSVYKVMNEGKYNNIKILNYNGKSLKPEWLLEELGKLGCREITIQTGGTLNQLFLKHHLIDKVNIIMTPILVGGKHTSTLIDGDAPKSLDDIGVLNLTSCRKLKNSYIQLKYDVVNHK